MNLKSLIKFYNAATQTITWMGGSVFNGPVRATARFTGVLTTVVYGAAPVLDSSLSNDFVMTITDGNAIVVAAPTNTPSAGFVQDISFTIRNASGGAHGALTWNAVFKTQATAFSAVADGFSRTVFFRWNGTNWVELVRTAADVAN